MNKLNFLNGIIHLPILELSGYEYENLEVGQQTVWEPCQTAGPGGQALYLWHRLISFNYSRIMV